MVVAALEYGVLPFIARARSEASVLDRVAWPVLLAATVMEVASLAAYTRLTQQCRRSAHLGSLQGLTARV